MEASNQLNAVNRDGMTNKKLAVRSAMAVIVVLLGFFAYDRIVMDDLRKNNLDERGNIAVNIASIALDAWDLLAVSCSLPVNPSESKVGRDFAYVLRHGVSEKYPELAACYADSSLRKLEIQRHFPFFGAIDGKMAVMLDASFNIDLEQSLTRHPDMLKARQLALKRVDGITWLQRADIANAPKK